MSITEIQYLPFTSLVDPSFWHTLIQKKIHEYKLNLEPKNLIGFFQSDNAPNLPVLASFEYNSFSEITEKPNTHVLLGKAFIFNTVDEFRDLDKRQFLTEQGRTLLDEIITTPLDQIDLNRTLNSFLLITYPDIKKYKCYYWFAFPAFSYPQNAYFVDMIRPISDRLNRAQINCLYDAYRTLSIQDRSFFVIELNEHNESLTVRPLHQFHPDNPNLLIAFADPSKHEKYPGWPLRNLLTLLAIKFVQSNFTIVALRIQKGSAETSCLFNVKLQRDSSEPSVETVATVGFERNLKQKLLPRLVDLSSSMDPKRLAENAIDLNLKLMKWRLMPNLNLDKLAQTKCLLLGSGTLGCNVARSLLGWGVRSITMVDKGTVSYSNPARQSLFEFSDCSPKARNKCEAAVEALKRIHPSVNARAEVLNVPMPGHSIADDLIEENRIECERLERLIEEHDCVFLLMDTRESRWLPTLLCHYKRKLCINAALGFDTYLVQRHGIRCETEEVEQKLPSSMMLRCNVPGDQLGCYFCSDVVAPGDSTKNRSLDQQCTVTRPGVSMIASALAVELMVSVLQHPDGVKAPAWNSLAVRNNEATNVDRSESLEPQEDEDTLGIIPHQIRGFLSQFNHVLPTCFAFDQCTACSKSVEQAYHEGGHTFLLRVFNQTDYLEEITGLKAMHEQTDFDDVWALSDQEEN